MAKQFPKGWVDLPPEKYADFGAMLYLSSLTPVHRDRMLTQAVYTFETPLRLGQYHIFRQNGFPRGFVTFAGLSNQAERRFAIKRQALKPEDYASGTSFWLIDLVAPFGQVRQMVEQLKQSIPHPRVRVNRLDSDLGTNRIVEWSRDDDGEVHMRLYRQNAFRKQLKAEESDDGL